MVTPPPFVTEIEALGLPPQIEYADVEIDTSAAKTPAQEIEPEDEAELEPEPEAEPAHEPAIASLDEATGGEAVDVGDEAPSTIESPEAEIEEPLFAETVAASPAEFAEQPAVDDVVAPAPMETAPFAKVAEPREPAHEAPVSIAPARPAAIAAEPPRREIPQDPLADVRDDVDTQVLPIFLEEAAELYPQAGEQLRAWRRAPNDDARARQLRRTLHTFKGSSRMAGAMRWASSFT
jgi:chemosensory pili system protein ChpA (sensor histidine kinase/response regulator)